MISIEKTRGYVIIALALAVVLLTAGTALASGEPEGWRATYDVAMKWLKIKKEDGVIVSVSADWKPHEILTFKLLKHDWIACKG